MPDPSSILLITKSRYIGDTILATPAMRAIAARYPHAAIDLLTGEGPAAAMQGAPFLNEISVVSREKRRSVTELFRAARDLGAKNYGMAVLFDRSLRSAILARLARIPKRVGFAVEFRGPLLTDRVPYDRIDPELDCLLRISTAAGAPSIGREMKLWVSEAEKRSACDKFSLSGQFACLAAAANEPHLRQWPVEHYRALIPELKGQGLNIVLLGASNESETVNQVAEGLDVVNLCGRTSVREALQIIAAASLFVSAEIGMSHCAVALETPSVIVHNPKKLFRWGHETEFAAALAAPSLSDNPTPGELQERLRAVTPKMVLDASRRVMRKEIHANT